MVHLQCVTHMQVCPGCTDSRHRLTGQSRSDLSVSEEKPFMRYVSPKQSRSKGLGKQQMQIPRELHYL